MITLALSTDCEVRGLEVLTIARMIMSYSSDQDLIEKVTMLQEYLDLAALYPCHGYGIIIGRTTTELLAVIHDILRFNQETCSGVV